MKRIYDLPDYNEKNFFAREHYHDPALDSYGETYESAFIAFAKKVRKRLPLDGSPSANR